MSNYWRLHCADCREDCDGESINHGGDTLIAMARAARLMAAIKDNAQFAAIDDIGLLINYRHVPLQWLWQHDGHRIVARDEYGREEKEAAYVGDEGRGAAPAGDPRGAGQAERGGGDHGGALDGGPRRAAAG